MQNGVFYSIIGYVRKEKNMGEIKTVDTRDSIKVVTSNDFITIPEISGLTLKARKLLYLALAQCRKDDKGFYHYEVTPEILSEQFNIGRNHVYEVADKLSSELMGLRFEVRENGKKKFMKRHVFDKCDYDDDSVFRFELHKDMTDYLLGLKRDFTQLLLADVMKMKSIYSIAIWHLMEREKQSRKVKIGKPIEFDLTLDELRVVTGTENKLKQVGQFKEKVLDKAIREFEYCRLAKVSYTNIKNGRTVVGFHFVMESLWGTYSPTPAQEEQLKKRIRKLDLMKKMNQGQISEKEYDELQKLQLELDQMSINDFMK